MSVIIDPGFALRFNGITDGVLIPTNQNVFHGKDAGDHRNLPQFLDAFTLETWIVPDCGGIVYEYENIF